MGTIHYHERRIQVWGKKSGVFYYVADNNCHAVADGCAVADAVSVAVDKDARDNCYPPRSIVIFFFLVFLRSKTADGLSQSTQTCYFIR